MSHGDARRIEQRIENGLRFADSTADDELKAHLSRYLCVLACGYIEAECCRVILQFAYSRANADIRQYVSRQLHYFQNPELERILQLAACFGETKRERLESIKDPKYKDSINSIVGNKNNIAHGVDTSISLVRFKEYYENARFFLKEFEKVFA